jgi:hypothetical protein
MKCDKAIQNFLEQEDCLYIPFRVRWHALLCSECREEIQSLKKIFTKAQNSYCFPMPEDLSGIIMEKITESNIIYEGKVSSSKWLLTGVIIFVSIFLISYSDSFIWLRQYFGSDLEIPLNLVLGMVITLYAASFIGSHLDDVKKIIDFFNDKIHQ